MKTTANLQLKNRIDNSIVERSKSTQEDLRDIVNALRSGALTSAQCYKLFEFLQGLAEAEFNRLANDFRQ